MIALAVVLVYLTIGLFFALQDKRRWGSFDARTILLWGLGLDIRLASWFELRRIEREGARKIAEAEAERDRTFEVLSVESHSESDEETFTVTCLGETRAWRGRAGVWRSPNGDHAAEWLTRKLETRWVEGRLGVRIMDRLVLEALAAGEEPWARLRRRPVDGVLRIVFERLREKDLVRYKRPIYPDFVHQVVVTDAGREFVRAHPLKKKADAS